MQTVRISADLIRHWLTQGRDLPAVRVTEELVGGPPLVGAEVVASELRLYFDDNSDATGEQPVTCQLAGAPAAA